MGPVGTTKVSLRIFGDDLDPDDITAALGREPTRAQLKGGPVGGREHSKSISPTGGWWLHTEQRTPGDLDGQVRELLGGLTQDLSVWAGLSGRCSRLDLFCGLFLDEGNQGETLSPETLLALGARHISLELDIYSEEHS